MHESRFRRAPDGRIELRLPPHERALLRELAAALRGLLAEDGDEPALRRLFPPAYEDPELEREFREFTHREARSRRHRALEVLEETLEHPALSVDEADAWLRALNDARLVLGTRLEITESFDWDAVDAEAEDAAELGVYAYTTWVQEQLVEATRT